MNPKAILLIIFTLIKTGIIIQSLYSADSYSNFTEATKTGKEIQIAEKKVVSFKAGKELDGSINN